MLEKIVPQDKFVCPLNYGLLSDVGYILQVIEKVQVEKTQIEKIVEIANKLNMPKVEPPASP